MKNYESTAARGADRPRPKDIRQFVDKGFRYPLDNILLFNYNDKYAPNHRKWDALWTCWAHETQMPVPEEALEYAGSHQAGAAFLDVERVRAFGSFAVFVDGTPLHFPRAKEPLAYRIRRIN